jgi:stage II sporulation protein AA (anti-sigma F factor antagonist)
MGLSISEEQNGDKRILRLEGSLDAQTVSSLESEIEALFEAQHRKVLLDFTQVDGLSSDSLQMLFEKTKKFTGGRGNLGLSNISSELMQVIQSAGLDRLLLIYRNEQEALRAMA